MDNGPKWVSISECLRLGFPFICLGRDFPFLFFFFFLLFSKRSHGQTDLAPRKALKTAPACAASAAPGLVVQPTLSQGVSPQGVRASPVSGEQVPEAGSSAEATIVLGEAVEAATALSPPSSTPTPTSIPAGATAGAPTVPPAAADVEMAEVPPPPAPSALVIPGSPILDHEEGAAVVDEVGERRLVTLAEERPGALTAEVKGKCALGPSLVYFGD